MSSQKFPRKKYETPLHPWKENRIKSERELMKKYGLKNHTEVWKAKTYLGKHREQARQLLAKVGTATPQVKKESDQLLLHLTRMGIIPLGSSLDDVLALDTESVLSRRLQTLVYLKGFSSTPYQARQLINHGHIAINSKKVTIPSYMVAKDEEGSILYTMRSPLNELSHPARPKREGYAPDVSVSPKTSAEEKPVVAPSPKPEPAPQPIATPAPAPETPAKPTSPAPPPVEEKTEKPGEQPVEKPTGKTKAPKKKEKKEKEA